MSWAAPTPTLSLALTEARFKVFLAPERKAVSLGAGGWGSWTKAVQGLLGHHSSLSLAHIHTHLSLSLSVSQQSTNVQKSCKYSTIFFPELFESSCHGLSHHPWVIWCGFPLFSYVARIQPSKSGSYHGYITTIYTQAIFKFHHLFQEYLF